MPTGTQQPAGVTRRRRGRHPVRRLFGADLTLGVLLLGATVLAVWVAAAPFETYVSSRERVAVLEQQAAALEAENARLEQRILDLDDPLTLELLAREQQGLVRPGEVPYVLTAPEPDRPRIVDPAPEMAASDPDVLVRLLELLQRLFS
jgi:cell division protein FtsB